MSKSTTGQEVVLPPLRLVTIHEVFTQPSLPCPPLLTIALAPLTRLTYSCVPLLTLAHPCVLSLTLIHPDSLSLTLTYRTPG